MLSEQQQRIMGYFIEEAKDHLNTIEQGLLNLQSTIEDPDLASEMFRAAHSVKGGAAMLGLGSIQTASHRLEDYFKVLKECSIKVDQRLETLLLDVFDALKELLEQLQGPFGLTDEKAAEVMAGVQPTFAALNSHLAALVAQSGVTPPDDVELTIPSMPAAPAVQPPAQPAVSEESALQLIFQSDVPARLREMLQLFKQGDTAGTRQLLQDSCRSLNQLGQQFEIHTWGDLLDLAERAIAHPGNSFRTLAPVVIRDIKQAQERVLAGRSGDIAASDALLTLLPPLDDFFPLDLSSDLLLENLATAPDAGRVELEDAAEQSLADMMDLSAIAAPESTADMNWLSESSAGQDSDPLSPFAQPPALEEDESVQSTRAPEQSGSDLSENFDVEFAFTPDFPDQGRNGSEMGMAELNSLADLFESDTPDMAISWQEEEILIDAETGLPEPLEFSNVSDFSDLLFAQEELDDLELRLPSQAESDEDLSGLLSDAEGAMRRESLSSNPFDLGSTALNRELSDVDTGLVVSEAEEASDAGLFVNSTTGEAGEDPDAFGDFFSELATDESVTALQGQDGFSDSLFDLDPASFDPLSQLSAGSESSDLDGLSDGFSDFELDFDAAPEAAIEPGGDRAFTPELAVELESLENLTDQPESLSEDPFSFDPELSDAALHEPSPAPRSWMDALDSEEGLASLPAAPPLWDRVDNDDVTADLWDDPMAIASNATAADPFQADPYLLDSSVEDVFAPEPPTVEPNAAFEAPPVEELPSIEELQVEDLQIPTELAADLASGDPFAMPERLDAFLADEVSLFEPISTNSEQTEAAPFEANLFEAEEIYEANPFELEQRASDSTSELSELDFADGLGEELFSLEGFDQATSEADLSSASDPLELDLSADFDESFFDLESLGQAASEADLPTSENSFATGDMTFDLDAELEEGFFENVSTNLESEELADELFSEVDGLLGLGTNPDSDLSEAIAPVDEDFLDFPEFSFVDSSATERAYSDSQPLTSSSPVLEESAVGDAFADDLDDLLGQELFSDTSNPSSGDDDFADLEAFLNNEAQSDDDFDSSFSQATETQVPTPEWNFADSTATAFAADAFSSESLLSDEDSELNALLSDFSDEDSLDERPSGNAAPGFDEFADLDLSLDARDNFDADATPQSDFSQSDFPQSDFADEVSDFSDLEALLGDEFQVEQPTSPPVFEPVNEFEDLERLLENADQTLGGSPTVRGIRNSGSVTNRRTNRRSPTPLADQTMRVSVKNLDGLNNLVGELVVNRNSLEQAEERLRQFLDNLLHQVQQLSDVGQRMRDLYERSLLESSLLSSRKSYQLSSSNTSPAIAPGNHSTGASFDALEMDRFTGFHTLSQEMIELIVRVRESSSDIEFVVEETDQITRNFRQITTQLQEGLTRARMVPFAQTADRLPRAVRDISVRCGKQAELIVEGRETLIDKMILEQLYDPMTHLVNNAITHGIESPEERTAMGKPAMGRITVRTFHQGNQTVISVSDDGAGIDPDHVKVKALEKGLITPEEARTMTRLDVYDLLFHHGFSTRDRADDLAGRGVGMDVVRTSLNDIRGVVNIDSSVGRGTTFTIRLPLTLSISKALSCISNRSRIAFPMDGVEDMLDVPRDRIQINAEGQSCIQWRDQLLPFQPLADLLKHGRSLGRGSVYGGNQEDDIVSVVVLRSNAGSYMALEVDQVLGEQEIVIKQLEGPVPKPLGIAGATVLGDGRIMPIADVLELIDLSMGRIRREAGSLLWDKSSDAVPAEPVAIKTDPTVLIVDDSITVRELLSMTFGKIGFRVEQARDGQEAWEKLRSGLPCDIVFCDIEMPRMDGLELLSRLQKDPTLNQIPIAMLTSRGADRHRQMAVQLGAKGYFTKPYLEEALLDAAQRMLKGEVLVST